MNDDKYIGLDVHQATISVAVLDSVGKVVMESMSNEPQRCSARPLGWIWPYNSQPLRIH